MNEKIAYLLYIVKKLGYNVSNSDYKIVPVENLIAFNTDELYYELLDDGSFQVVNTEAVPSATATYYKIENATPEFVATALLKEYEYFFGIESDESFETRYNDYSNPSSSNYFESNISKLDALDALYARIGIDINNIYYNDNGIYKKVEKTTLKFDEDFAEAVLGLTDDIELTKQLLNLNDAEVEVKDGLLYTNDENVLYTNTLTEELFARLKDYIYYINEDVVFEVEDTLISILRKINKIVLTDEANDTITINKILYFISGLVKESLDIRLEKIKQNLIDSKLTPSEYFTSENWVAPAEGENLTTEQATKNINTLEELFEGNKLSTFTVKENDTFKKYNFIDLTAVERLKSYVDEYIIDYMSKELYSTNINVKLSELNNKLNTVIKEIYNSSNINSESNFQSLSKKIKDINTTLEGIGYNISPTYNIKLPKASNNNSYLYSDKNGKAKIGYFSEIVEPGDSDPITSRAVYENTKLYHKSGDCAGFGKVVNDIEETITFDKENLDKLSTVPLDYSSSLSNPVSYFTVNDNNSYFTVPSIVKVIYIPAIRGGTLKVELNSIGNVTVDNLLLAKNQEAMFNFDDDQYFIKGSISDNILTFTNFDENIIFKKTNGINYIALINKGNKLDIEKITYSFNEDNTLRINNEEIIANKKLTAKDEVEVVKKLTADDEVLIKDKLILEKNFLIGRVQSDDSFTDTSYTFSSDTELNSLI